MCDVLMAVIGQQWMDLKGAGGARRLDDPNDVVRTEIAYALRREIPVVPVLVRGASMPEGEHLPEELRELAYRNAVELTHPVEVGCSGADAGACPVSGAA